MDPVATTWFEKQRRHMERPVRKPLTIPEWAPRSQEQRYNRYMAFRPSGQTICKGEEDSEEVEQRSSRMPMPR